MRRILTVGLLGVLVSCAPLLMGVNRERVARRLEHTRLGLPKGITQVLARDMPRPIAKFISDEEHESYVAGYVRCMSLKSPKGDGSPDSVQEYVCICNHPRTMSYVAIVTQQGGQWSNSWDTTFTCHWPCLQVDTVRLGIEHGWRPTIQLSGPVDRWGLQEFHFIRWDGAVARNAIHRFAIGHWYEIMDIDGDGVMELNIPRAGDEPGSWRNRVYTYRPSVGQYWLDADEDFPIDTGALEFGAEFPKDTFFTHERIWVTFEAYNTSRVTFPYTLLSVNSEDIRMKIFDESGELIGGHVLQVNPGLKYCFEDRLCEPGDNLFGVSRIDDHVRMFDSSLARNFTPPGNYTAIFEWKYDAHRRAIFNETAHLEDTLHYVVVPPEGIDAEAKDAWLSLNWRTKKTQHDSEQLLEVYTRFRDTPFGAMALRELIGWTQGGIAAPYPPNTDYMRLNREMTMTYPDHPTIRVVLSDFERRYGRAEMEALLKEICDSVPSTLAGRLATEYLTGDH